MFDKEKIKNKVASIKDYLVETRRYFHSHPEIGFEEINTMNKISSSLNLLNIKHKTGIAKTGVIADIEGIDTSFRVAFRGDIDALPIKDMKNIDYASKEEGKCHACGHDVHTTIVLGIAKIFSDEKPPCNIRLIFQPAEENFGGALPMIEEGVLDNVDLIYGLHVSPNYEVGSIAVRNGVLSASSNEFTIKVHGKSSHGAASPSKGIDAIIIAAQIITSLQTLISRSINGTDSAALNIGIINGGYADNVVCDLVEMKGTLRTFLPEIRSSLLLKMNNIVCGMASSMGGNAEFIDYPSYPSVVNHDESVAIVRKSGLSLLGGDNVLECVPSMGVEDFSYFLEKIPGAFFNLGTANKKKGIDAPLHNGLFDIDESALEIGLNMQIYNLYNSFERG